MSYRLVLEFLEQDDQQEAGLGGSRQDRDRAVPRRRVRPGWGHTLYNPGLSLALPLTSREANHLTLCASFVKSALKGYNEACMD